MICKFLSIIIVLFGSPVAATAQFKDNWQDKSPHKSVLVNANGVKLHYLDWGGKGETLLFLHGLNQSAHIYDELAPQFKDKFRVLALTRRGQGKSDKPETGYDTPVLTEDLRQFLDGLKIKRVILAGHSMAGKELTLFATLYPERVIKLIYLDAAYNYREQAEAVKNAPDEEMPKDALSSFTAFREHFKKTKCGWSEAWEADMRETIVFAPDGKPLRLITPDKVMSQLVQGMRASNPDYSKIKVPVLSFCVLNPFPECSFPPNMTKDERVKMQPFIETLKAYLQRGADRFKRELPNAKIVELSNTDHWFFIQNQAEVVREMRAFLMN
jgi:non-heme chloroperoxidase